MRPKIDENKDINNNYSNQIHQRDSRDRNDSFTDIIKNNYLLNSKIDADNSLNLIQFDSTNDISNRITNINVKPSIDLSNRGPNINVIHLQEIVIIL